jgi:hypothetical protein
VRHLYEELRPGVYIRHSTTTESKDGRTGRDESLTITVLGYRELTPEARP